ncbi:MAG: CAP domain-containing protein [Myxococcota bacterium]
MAAFGLFAGSVGGGSIGCGSDAAGEPSARYAPGTLPPGYGAATPAPPQLGSAVTPFGELLQQIPMLAEWPQLPGLDQLPELFPQWPWPAPSPATQPSDGPSTGPGAWPAAHVAWEDEVLRLTNARRATGANCGGQALAAAPPVVAQPQLRAAARAHGVDMGRRDYFDHRTPEGVGPMQRAQGAGFSGGFVGENIAAGQRSPAEVVQAWVESPGHCVNLMNPRFRYLGVGYTFETNDRYGHFWVQKFGG